jgi:peroxiredoxin family protein
MKTMSIYKNGHKTQILTARAATGEDVVCFFYFEKLKIFQNKKNKPFSESSPIHNSSFIIHH